MSLPNSAACCGIKGVRLGHVPLPSPTTRGVAYAYDDLNRLLSEITAGTAGTTTTYTYDLNGNRSTKSITPGEPVTLLDLPFDASGGYSFYNGGSGQHTATLLAVHDGAV